MWLSYACHCMLLYGRTVVNYMQSAKTFLTINIVSTALPMASHFCVPIGASKASQVTTNYAYGILFSV